MNCIKTGAVVHLPTHGDRYIADLYEKNGILVFRIAGRIKPDQYDRHPVTHTVNERIGYFDYDTMSVNRNATLIASQGDVTYHGTPVYPVPTYLAILEKGDEGLVHLHFQSDKSWVSDDAKKEYIKREDLPPEERDNLSVRAIVTNRGLLRRWL